MDSGKKTPYWVRVLFTTVKSGRNFPHPLRNIHQHGVHARTYGLHTCGPVVGPARSQPRGGRKVDCGGSCGICCGEREEALGDGETHGGAKKRQGILGPATLSTYNGNLADGPVRCSVKRSSKSKITETCKVRALTGSLQVKRKCYDEPGCLRGAASARHAPRELHSTLAASCAAASATKDSKRRVSHHEPAHRIDLAWEDCLPSRKHGTTPATPARLDATTPGKMNKKKRKREKTRDTEGGIITTHHVRVIHLFSYTVRPLVSPSRARTFTEYKAERKDASEIGWRTGLKKNYALNAPADLVIFSFKDMEGGVEIFSKCARKPESEESGTTHRLIFTGESERKEYEPKNPKIRRKAGHCAQKNKKITLKQADGP
ncbi:hypothetical protein C8J57DRAFT_1212077 [Mycena rebaudengoi]|nr:hypothetical protein C8J57DRAFT_1212077 [Mycena rebaudengoi]